MGTDKVTGIILNWKRPDYVMRILTGWQGNELIGESIVWDNNPTSRFHHDGTTVIRASQDMGLYTRFAAACLARHDCVLIQDDDLELPDDSLRTLYTAWKKDPDIIHGVFGRMSKPDGSYARNVNGNAHAPIILTRALLAHRRYAADFFSVAPLFDDVQREGKPVGNGEDIIFSYVVMRATGRFNRVHRVSVKELPAPHSIHGRNWKGHVAHRTRLLRACEAWLKENQHEDRRDLLHV